MTVPCFNCTTRHSGCHGTCAAYLAYKRELDNRRALQREARARENDLAAVRFKKHVERN